MFRAPFFRSLFAEGWETTNPLRANSERLPHRRWLARRSQNSRSVHSASLIDRTVNLSVAQNRFDILACLRKWNRLYKLVEPTIRPGSLPIHHAVIPRVVGGQCVFLDSAKPIEQLAQIPSPKPNVRLRIEKLKRLEVANPFFLRQLLPGGRLNLHQPIRVRIRNHIRIKLRLLPYQRSHKIRIKLFLADSALIVSHHACGNRIRQYASGIDWIGADIAKGRAFFSDFIAR